MIEYKNDKIQEKYYVEVLENGLTVYLYPKKRLLQDLCHLFN